MTELTIRCATSGDWSEVADLGARVFAQAEHGDEQVVQRMVQGWLNLARNPALPWENTRIGLVDGRIVAHVSFVDRTLCLGASDLRFGGIAGVCTHPDYRQHGYAALLVRDVLRQMQDERYPLALLDGVPRYYDRFGYGRVWPNRALKFFVREAQRVPENGYRVRPFEDRDMPALLALYEAQWGLYPVRVRRSPEWLRWRLNRTPEHGLPFTFVVEEDEAGAVRGYSAGRNLYDRVEVVVADPDAAAALLHHTAQLLSQEPDREVQWLDLPTNRTSRYAERVCSVHYNTWATHRGGWMGRFVDLPAAVDALHPEIAARTDRAGLPGGRLTLESDDTLALHTGARTIQLPPLLLLQLLCGALSPDDVDDLPDYALADCDVLKAVFPPAMNGLAGLDWF